MNKVHIAILAAILTVALGLRLFRLGHQSLWIDEIASVRTAASIDDQGFSVVAQRDNVSPLSHWLLYPVVKYAGRSEWIVRLPAAVAGSVTALLVYFLGAQMVSRRVGLTAAAFVAVSPFAIWHSQDARMYSLLMCFSTAIMLLHWRIVTNESRLRHWLCVTALTAAAVYTHQYAVFLSLACGLFLLLSGGFRKALFWKWLVSQLAAALLFVPWLVLSIHRIGYGAGTAKGGQLMWIPYTIFSFAYGFSLGPSVRELHWQTGLAAVLPYLVLLVPLVLATAVLGIAGLVALFRRHRPAAFTFCVVCMAVPLLGAALAASFTRITYNVRYVVMSWPAFVLILATGMTVLKTRRTIVAAGTVMGVGLMLSAWNMYFDARYAKEDYRSAAAFLAREVKPGDLMIISSVSAVSPLEYYGLAVPSDVLVVRTANLAETLGELSTRDIGTQERVWLVEARAWESDFNGELRRTLEARLTAFSEEHWPGISVYCFGSGFQGAQRGMSSRSAWFRRVAGSGNGEPGGPGGEMERGWCLSIQSGGGT